MRRPLGVLSSPSVVPDSLQNDIRPDTPGRLLMPREKAPIEQINGVWRFVRLPGDDTRIFTPAGHAMQLVIRGSYTLRTLGADYLVSKGTLIYYHDSQEIETMNVSHPVTFYSVGFIAPSLKPPPIQERIRQSTKPIQKAFESLYDAARTADPYRRALRTFAALYTLLALLDRGCYQPIAAKHEESAWWGIERDLRQQGVFRPTIKYLCRIYHRSPSTIGRLCRDATNISPMRRLQAFRMAEAFSLLQCCPMTVTQIAECLGYPRIHEFSREFSAYFGICPSTVRDLAERAPRESCPKDPG